MPQTELEEAMTHGQSEKCVEILANWTEAERRRSAPSAIAVYRRMYRSWISDIRSGEFSVSRPHVEAAQLAILGVATVSEMKEINVRAWNELTYDVLRDRRPSWISDWADWALTNNYVKWDIVRKLIITGVSPRLSCDSYLLRMAHRACHHHIKYPMTVKDFFLTNSDLLENEVWELLGIEGNKEISLTSLDKYSRNAVAHAFLELTNEGYLPRSRMLDVTLTALLADYPQYRAGWFSRFHDLLGPTMEERAERIDTYLALLSSRIPPTVSFALDAAMTIDRAGLLDPVDGVAAIRPVFYSRDKGAHKLALKLVSSWVDTVEKGGVKFRDVLSPAEFIDTALDAVVPALEHESRDTREAAQKFIRKYRAIPDEPDESIIQPLSLLAAIQPPTEIVAKVPISPVESVEELVEVLSAVLENEGPVAEIERALDGLSRLCAERPDNFVRLTGPLLKRAKTHLGDLWEYCFFGSTVRLVIAGLVRAWLEAELPPAPSKPWRGDMKILGPERFIGARVKELASRAAGRGACPLLSAPPAGCQRCVLLRADACAQELSRHQ